MNQFISLETAVDMTTLYRQEKENILDPDFRGQNILANSETFDREVFDTLLGRTGCAAIRIYYGMDETKKVHAIIVPVDAENADMIPGANRGGAADSNDDFGEQGRRCPVDCPPESPLNP